MVNKDLTVRSAAEELWLARKAIGRTQAGQAAWLGVSRSALQGAELGRPTPCLNGLWKPIQAPETPLLLALARRRSGLGLRGAARLMGVSHVSVFKWEMSGDQRLIDFWARRGFRFTFA